MLKKIIILIGTLFFAFLVAVISAPFFVDVDKYRPEIVRTVNEKINGKIELGKLSLSLWGAVKVGAESIHVKVNGFDKPLLDAKEFRIEIPYLSFLTGPQVIAVAKNPKIIVERAASGVLNIQALSKAEKSAQNSSIPSAGREVAAEKGGSDAAIPAVLLTSSLGLSIENGDVDYLDRQNGDSYQFVGLMLEGRNLGINRKMKLKFSAPSKGKQANLTFQGEINGDINLEPIVKDGALKSVNGTAVLDAGKMSIEYGKGLFHKTDSMPLKIDAAFEGDEKEMIIRKIDFNIYDLIASGKGVVVLGPALKAKIEVNSNSWDLEKLENLVPMLKAYALKGKAQLNLAVNSEGNKNSAHGEVKITDGQFFMKEYLKEPLKAQVQAAFSENSLTISRLSLLGPDSDLQVQGNVRDFNAPKFSFSINGKSFNLDKTVVLPETKAAVNFSLINEAYAAKEAGVINPMLPLMANPLMAKASGVLTAKITKIIAMGAELKNVDVESQLSSGGLLQLKKVALEGFGGRAGFVAALSMGSKAMDYKTNGKANGVSAKEVISAYFPRFKNTLEGKVDADWNVAGGLYPASNRMASMTGSAKINAANGILRTADFKDSIQGVMNKVPFLKNKKAPDWEDGFKTLRADMKFNRGNIQVEPMELISKGKGFDIRGRSNITAQLEQESYLDVYDPHGLLPKEISQPNKVAIPLKIVGSLMSPKTDFSYTVSRLASTTGKEAAKNAIGKGLQKILGGQEGGAPGGDPVKKLGDQLKKKFKF